MNNKSLNFIITGKAGVGKSSFLNYLIGSNVFKAGSGEPVTQKYFENVDFTDGNGILYRLYDTKGIEPTTTLECMDQIFQMIEKRDQIDNVYEWIHTVYYCFAASNKRIEPFEIDFIKELSKKVGVIILLTKRDLVSDVDLEKLRQQIMIELTVSSIQVIPVCSISQETRKGKSEKSGREDVLRASFYGLWNKLANSMPNKMVNILNGDLKDGPQSMSGGNEKYTPFKSYLLHVSIKGTVLPTVFSSMQGIPEFKYLAAMFGTQYVNYHKLLNSWNNLFNIEKLGQIPSLSELLIFDLSDKESRKDVRLFTSALCSAILKFKEDVQNLDVDKFWAEHENRCKDVFDFYRDINRYTPAVLITNHSKNILQIIKHYNFSQIWDKIVGEKKNFDKCLNEIDDCFFFDSREVAEAQTAYETFRGTINSFANDFVGKIDSFVNTYKAELRQYGQYCLRNKDLEVEILQMSIESEKELSEKEYIYYNMLKCYIDDGHITSSERNKLDVLREMLRISARKAGLIEDLLRRNLWFLDVKQTFNLGTPKGL